MSKNIFLSINFFSEETGKKKADNPSGQQRKTERKRNKSRRVARQHTAIRRSQHFALPLCRSLLVGRVRWLPAIT